MHILYVCACMNVFAHMFLCICMHAHAFVHVDVSVHMLTQDNFYLSVFICEIYVKYITYFLMAAVCMNICEHVCLLEYVCVCFLERFKFKFKCI